MDTREAMLKVSELMDRCESEDDLKPRPKVAALILDDQGNFIGEAYRGQNKAGEHAEYTLLEGVLKDVDLKDCVAFVSLEPCSLRSQDKLPCSQRLIQRGIKRVYVANLDPNPFIRGNGIQRLLDHGLDVRFFDKDIADTIADKNYDFIKEYYSKSLYNIEQFISENSNRSLDDWKYSINKIYYQRNFAFPVSSIFMHFVESIGDLAETITKSDQINRDRYEEAIAKCLAWWLALCSKANISSVKEMVLLKFPRICPYCESIPHKKDDCKKFGAYINISWDQLFEIQSKLADPPETLDQFNIMFKSIYPETDDLKFILAKLIEEMGELAESCRYLSEHPGYFWSESADVFAWLMAIHSHVAASFDSAVSLNDAMSKFYPDACRDCGQIKCGCPPLLDTKLSRLAQESPSENIIRRFYHKEF